MAEVLFVLLVVYVVYVVQNVMCKDDVKKVIKPEKSPKVSVTEAVKQNEERVVVQQPEPAVEKVAAVKSAPKKTTKAKPKATAKSKQKSSIDGLRNPETGEIDKVANSYRMTKRWIKEALVTEGLLPKVYKTNELDDAVKLKAKKALDKLAKMDKYQ